ncbi:hypothetical protein GWK47_050228 [Chionoecetes opilio]|uniref:Uncharacterized protein n=1 Tax=Chionoecetes opilio TaxID=41210 RepID=A0A8J5CEG7_CHIOP|nr:hypothetical protein GWK47_050228 [Chionoecetes opilio]
MHSTCYASLSSKRKFCQAEKCKQKSEEHLERNEASDQQDPPPEASAPKRLRSSMSVLHGKTLCVWCMKGGYKSSNRDKQILFLSTVDVWTKFNLHTVRLENDVMRLRFDTLIAYIPDSQTAFGLEIRYHRSCWRKYVSDHKPLSDVSTQHLQRVNLREAQALFFHHIRQVIFKDHEIRTLQSLLQDYNPPVRSIASILTSYITGKCTAFEINLSVLLHGLTRSKEIVDIMHKDGLGISYNDVIMLRDFWVVNDLNCSSDCPFELAKGKPTIAIVDNDDFKSDTLSGAGQSHRTNVMFVLPESFDPEHPSQNPEDRPVLDANLASNLSTTLKDLGSEKQNVNPYKTAKRGEPPLRKPPADDSIPPDTSVQRILGVIHALARAQDDRPRPTPEEQTVSGFSGFHASMSKCRREERGNIPHDHTSDDSSESEDSDSDSGSYSESCSDSEVAD